MPREKKEGKVLMCMTAIKEDSLLCETKNSLFLLLFVFKIFLFLWVEYQHDHIHYILHSLIIKYYVKYLITDNYQV